ncbi:MAG: oligopeptidase B, partial [Janthinobacterium sp.]
LNAENAYTAAVTAPIQPLADKLFAEVKGRMQEVDLSVPARQGNFYYYTRMEAGKQYPIHCRRPVGANGAYDAQAVEEILLDQNQLAEGHKFFAVRAFAVSPNEQLLAYTTDTTGFRQYELHVKDLKTGKLLGDTMPRVTSLAWAADNATLMLTQEDATTKRADRLFRLPLGGTLQQVYHEPVEQFAIGVSRTRDHRYFVLTARSTDTSEVLLLPTSQPQGNFQSVLKREKGHRYGIEHRDGQLYILTNKDAKNFRVVSAPLSAPQPKHWKPVVPHNKDAVIQSIDVFQGYLVVMEKARALNRARILDFAHKNWKTVQFDDPVYLATSAGTPEFSATQFRMSYQSPVTPPTVIDVNMQDGKRTVLKQQEIVGGFDGSRYTTQRLWVKARDGVQVPLWIVYKKGVKLDGSAPLLL